LGLALSCVRRLAVSRRLGSARYRWQIVQALPPMRRTRERAEVEAFLAALDA